MMPHSQSIEGRTARPLLSSGNEGDGGNEDAVATHTDRYRPPPLMVAKVKGAAGEDAAEKKSREDDRRLGSAGPPTGSGPTGVATTMTGGMRSGNPSSSSSPSSANNNNTNGGGKARRPTFPVLLHEILSRPDFSDVISWMPHGRSWKVLRPSDFTNRASSEGYFEHAKFSSFVRQANGWGFRRILQGYDAGSYYHEMFLRGRPDLVRHLKRGGGGAAAQSEAADVDASDDEPDFYVMGWVHPHPNLVVPTLGRTARGASEAAAQGPPPPPYRDYYVPPTATAEEEEEEEDESEGEDGGGGGSDAPDSTGVHRTTLLPTAAGGMGGGPVCKRGIPNWSSESLVPWGSDSQEGSLPSKHRRLSHPSAPGIFLTKGGTGTASPRAPPMKYPPHPPHRQQPAASTGTKHVSFSGPPRPHAVAAAPMPTPQTPFRDPWLLPQNPPPDALADDIPPHMWEMQHHFMERILAMVRDFENRFMRELFEFQDHMMATMWHQQSLEQMKQHRQPTQGNQGQQQQHSMHPRSAHPQRQPQPAERHGNLKDLAECAAHARCARDPSALPSSRAFHSGAPHRRFSPYPLPRGAAAPPPAPACNRHRAVPAAAAAVAAAAAARVVGVAARCERNLVSPSPGGDDARASASDESPKTKKGAAPPTAAAAASDALAAATDGRVAGDRMMTED